MSTYLAWEPFPPSTLSAPPSLPVFLMSLSLIKAPRYRRYRPEFEKSAANRRGERHDESARSLLRNTPDVTDHSRHRASSIIIYRGDERHEFASENNPVDDDGELEARLQAVEVGARLRAQVRNLIGATPRYTCRFNVFRSPTTLLVARVLNIKLSVLFQLRPLAIAVPSRPNLEYITLDPLASIKERC